MLDCLLFSAPVFSGGDDSNGKSTVPARRFHGRRKIRMETQLGENSTEKQFTRLPPPFFWYTSPAGAEAPSKANRTPADTGGRKGRTMNITNETMVTIHYTLKDSEGEILDTSREEGGEPLEYIHGLEMVVPGLEKALAGKKKGDKFNTEIAPEEGYGEYDDELLAIVPKENFEGFDEDLEPGMQFEAEFSGGPRLITVVEIEGDDVTIDCNHPLAGETLFFDIEVMGVRKATKEELEAAKSDCSGCGGGCCDHC